MIDRLKVIILSLAVAACTITLCGCTGSESSYSDYDNSYRDYDNMNGIASVDGVTSAGESNQYNDNNIGMSSSSSVSNTDNKSDESTENKEQNNVVQEVEINPEKLVYTANIDIEVLNFDEAVEKLDDTVSEFGGIIQDKVFYDDTPWEDYYGQAEYALNESYKSSGYKRLNITIRIPTSRFDEFISLVGNVGHITNSESYVTNITQEYYSNKAYLESYQNQLNILQDMYDKASSIQEMVTVQDRITEVQAEINRLTTRITSMDRDVAYSTITIYLSEVTQYSSSVKEYDELTFGEKVSKRFISSWNTLLNNLENILYFLIDIMWLVIFIAIVTVIVIYIRITRRKKLILKGVIDEYGRLIYPHKKVSESNGNEHKENEKEKEDIDNKQEESKK